MARTILVATDGSSHAEKAVSLATELANLNGANIVLLHAIPDLIHGTIPAGYEELARVEHLEMGDILTAAGNEILARAEERLRAKGVEAVTSTLPRGPAAQAILDYASGHAVDIIVVGSRGLSNLKGLMLGSVSHKVSQLAPCSCVIVR